LDHILISNNPISSEEFRTFIKEGTTLELSLEVKSVVQRNRLFLENELSKSEVPLYGINTGFGSLCNVRISSEDITTLQKNLVMSHACGTGEEVPESIVRIILLLKILSLSKGYSGVRPVILEHLCRFYNEGIYPVIYQQGSLGASGDLAPLAHMSLPLIGMGEVRYKGKKIPASQVLQMFKIPILDLQAKEGLALLNGTQFSTAYTLWGLLESSNLLNVADFVTALSCDAFLCNQSPFLPQSHQIRPHMGQIRVAAHISSILNDSQIWKQPKEFVQDPYSFRCVPQVHGAGRDVYEFVKKTIETEINSVTDNPNIFDEEELIISAGNFHAQPIAYAADFLAIALSEFGNISERRTFQLISGLRKLPPFLVTNSGLNSGMMIAQYTAASIVSQNKQYCSPASIDSIVSSAGQEDHVSMASNAGTKLFKVVENTWTILAIEWMVAAQAFEFRRPLKSSEKIEHLLSVYRQIVPPLITDRVLHDDIVKTKDFLKATF
jgi:histidine ammonia-lyase